MATDELEALLVVQQHDTALDRLRHRRATLPERAEAAARAGEREEREKVRAAVAADRDAVAGDERRLDQESATLGAHAAEVDTKLYSGTVTSPRELQAMQADLEMLRRQISEIEDRELAVMEQREALDAALAEHDAAIAATTVEIDRLSGLIAEAEGAIDAEIAEETDRREMHVAAVSAKLLADYETRRARNKGAGAARLIGATCGACHLSIPASEAEEIRRGGGGAAAYCDNCGAILVP